MKREILDFKNYDLEILNHNEMLLINGGGFLTWLGVIGAALVCTGAIIASGGLVAVGFAIEAFAIACLTD